MKFALFVFLTAAAQLGIFLTSEEAYAATRTCESLFQNAQQKEKSPVANGSASYESVALELLQSLEGRADQISGLMNENARDMKPERRARLRALTNLIEAYHDSTALLVRALNTNAILRLDDGAADMRALIDEEQASLQAQIKENLKQMRKPLIDFLQPSGDVALIEISPSRAGNFADSDLEHLVGMYHGYTEKKGWTVTVLDQTFVDHRLRNISLQIEGPQAYRLLSFDRGDHRFIAADASTTGKRFTRYAEVQVYRPPEPLEFRVSDSEFLVTTTKSSGPGGQHVNKTDSAVHVVHRPSGMFTKVSSDRSQHRNRAMAIQMLTARLFEQSQKEREATLRAARAEGRNNSFVNEAAARWTRTYDWTTDSTLTNRILGGDLDAQLMPFQEAALVKQITKFTQQIESGTSDLLR